jgi:mRNA interferase MazF
VETIRQGDVWWADLPAPQGSEPGFRRPVIVVQGNRLNRTSLATVVCVSLTTNLHWADAPGNVLLTPDESGLDLPSVANVSQIATVDRADLIEKVGKVSRQDLESILAGIDIVLGR